jgi:hypothetical protein
MSTVDDASEGLALGIPLPVYGSGFKVAILRYLVHESGGDGSVGSRLIESSLKFRDPLNLSTHLACNARLRCSSKYLCPPCKGMALG